ncbi:MAG: DNA-processing protein DprA, partial [Lachnospiraceae bacterium]|nr:DNA-processing protein DprA [Lachnospiraceae bacterium]
WDVTGQWKLLGEKSIRMVIWDTPEYPRRLYGIPDAPLILYEKGLPYRNEGISVAVIGARNCSSYGSLAAKELGRYLAEASITVVSGMALGVDGISQWATLEAGGYSVGLLGSGVEHCYPKENYRLYQRLLKEGTVVSEYPIQAEPRAGNFPRRNRLISGLADIVAVVEAREKSGTLITVDMALEQGRDVYAMPGRITDVLSRGCNQLIRQGAGILMSPREFVEELLQLPGKGDTQLKKGEEPAFSDRERQLFELLEPFPISFELLFQKAKEQGIRGTQGELLEELLQLCIRKKAYQKDGYFFREL